MPEECPYCPDVEMNLNRDRTMWICPACFMSFPRTREPLGSRN